MTTPAAGPGRARWTLTACVLLHRGGRWLLTVRGADVDDAPGRLGLVGGHVEAGADAGTGVLEDTARREAREETGVDLAGVDLHYLESELFATDAGVPQVCVTYWADAPEAAEARAADPTELSEVRWSTAEQARADPRCPDWLPALLLRADRARAAVAG